MHPIKEKKEELKQLALKIRKLKSQRKETDNQWEISLEKRKFRHDHIAYCLVRGRVYEQIEQPHENNKPNWNIINKSKDNLQKQIEQWRLSNE